MKRYIIVGGVALLLIGVMVIMWPFFDSERYNAISWVNIKGGLPGCALNSNHELICWRSTWPKMTDEGGVLYLSYGGNDIEHVEVIETMEGVYSFEVEGALVCAIKSMGIINCKNIESGRVWNVYEPGENSREEFVKIVMGMELVCALTKSNEAKCWEYKFLLNSDYHEEFVEVDFCMASDSECEVGLAVGVKCACKIDEEGKVFCCGDFCNQRPIDKKVDKESLSMGEEHICALDLSGSVVCARMGTHFGHSWQDYQCMLNVPAGEFTKIDVGEFHACGLRSDRSVVCWGGIKDESGSCDMPVDRVPGEYACKEYMKDVRQTGKERPLCNIFSDGQEHHGKYSSVSVSDRQMCLLKESGTVRCRGDWNFELNLN